MGYRRPGNARTTEVQLRHARWLELSAQGRSARRIAEDDGVATSTVTRALEKMLSEVKSEAAAALRAYSDERLRQVIETCFDELAKPHPLIRDGQRHDDITDATAIVSLLRTVVITDASLRRLHGVDAPTKAEVRVTDDLTAEIEQLAAELASAGDPGPDRSPAGRSPQSPAGPAAS